MRTIIIAITLVLLSCNNRKEKDPVMLAQSEYFRAIGENDVKLKTPKAGEWLFEHKEKGQTFEAYKGSKPIRPTSHKAVIYLMPIGDFTPLQEKGLKLTRDYVEIFFQLKTILLKKVTDKTVPPYAIRQKGNNNIQLLAPYVLDSLLWEKTPRDGIALLAISAKDLYPKNDWNYVFGLASYTRRVGVSSIYRLQNKQLDTVNFGLFLRRLVNISSHEIGHMMSIQHCTFAMCVMNGSNSLQETDLSSNRLCSECQKKLFWNFRYDNKQRLKQLYDFCLENNLEWDAKVLKLDSDVIK
ncbi:archaemetzincin [Chitinophaga arvensicola]|uniref:Archaemetzincin n=1 Tax=Chitinophaga arvensicola TaxID=29529 RepID=A0A1I0QWV7_9BACT|nr:archaemetzincin [Chitinophaga arvensicola]SEW32247.1 archaemetzincin [Chitinophaga arvensicola]